MLNEDLMKQMGSDEFESARSGEGVFVFLADHRGFEKFYIPFDSSAPDMHHISSPVLHSVLTWLANGKYVEDNNF